jgi:hypothetical protein
VLACALFKHDSFHTTSSWSYAQGRKDRGLHVHLCRAGPAGPVTSLVTLLADLDGSCASSSESVQSSGKHPPMKCKERQETHSRIRPRHVPFMTSSQWVYSYPQGQWVYASDRGWIWVPAGTATTDVHGVPYVCLYMPVYGWTWYISPWGLGPYHYGGWVQHPWLPLGWRGAWVTHPRVVSIRMGFLGGFRGGFRR